MQAPSLQGVPGRVPHLRERGSDKPQACLNLHSRAVGGAMDPRTFTLMMPWGPDLRNLGKSGWVSGAAYRPVGLAHRSLQAAEV